MKLKKLLIQLVMLIGVGFVLLPYSAQTALALTSDNTTTTIDDVKVDLKQIKEIARPTWQIINSNDGRDGRISQSLAASVVSVVNADTQNDGWVSASDMLSWLYPNDTIEALKSENISAEQAVAWLNSKGYSASIVNRSLTTDEIKKSLDNTSPIVTIFESQDSANWLEKQTTGVLYAHTDVEAGTEKLHQSFVKTAYHGELSIQDGTEQSPFKFEDQDENPNSSIAASEYKWVKSITDIKKDPTWESSSKILSNRASGVFNVNLTKSGNDITGAEFTDPDVQALRRKHPATIKDSETKLAAVSLINLYFDDENQKTVADLETFAKIETSQEVTGEQIVNWYKSLGFSCDTSQGRLTKDLTKSLSSSGKLYLTTYKALDKKDKIQQLASIGKGFTENNFGYNPDISPVIRDESISTVYNINWSGQNAYQEYLARNKSFNYDYFTRIDISKGASQGDYQSDLTIYNIRQKSAPEVENTQFKPIIPDVTVPEKTGTFNSNNNFYIRETQGSEPWCAAYVNAAAINTLGKATDTPITTAKTIMQADCPDLSDEELSKTQGSTIENFVNIINSKYNMGVTVEDRALSFDEVKKEIDDGLIIEMDVYDANAETYEEKLKTEHAVAIVGYVTPRDGDKSKVPYYEIWNPWWPSTFYIPANAETFNLGGVNYKWGRSWYNWRHNGSVSVDESAAKQKVAGMGNPSSVVEKNLIEPNPLLRGKNVYSNNNLKNSEDVMQQYVSAFGRETTAWSLLGGDTFGYAQSTEKAHATQRARHGKRTVNTPSNSDVAKTFKKDVDALNRSYEVLIGMGLGNPIIKTIANVFKGKGDSKGKWNSGEKDKENFIAGLFKLLGISIGKFGLASYLYAIEEYVGVESMIRIDFTMCLYD
ncbi:C47 family peptidase [Lactococcus raffinolactis]|uniref:C47 family peptidase n=1 Tax=Pseudolactococcus raffinolactis TaxID=1366 RepID=UPI000BB4EB45|nr:C47 family peptidase [Lactococcus raffinolactis]ATC61283.1 hypothetical protein CMV25_05020 [Lactococcus raffinolactis]QIW52535.1 hypothetical protein GU337_11930 [Lactococcus raffinolactis]QIW56865.1 hypothetical protein GU335_09960 [Lactococcus raffinolactis]